MNIKQCPYCQGSMKVQKLKCLQCGISIEGEFYTSPILSLSADEQIFVELFVRKSGSLKEMANIMQVTYPTIRTRLNAIISKMEKVVSDKERHKQVVLNQVEAGKLTPETAANIIKNL